MKSVANKKKCLAERKSFPQKEPKAFFVYILEMENGSFYTGYTDDPISRFRKHCSGKGAKFTRAFKPVRIASLWRIEGGKGNAMSAEAFVKTLPRAQKEKLVGKPVLFRKLLRDAKQLSCSVVRVPSLKKQRDT